MGVGKWLEEIQSKTSESRDFSLNVQDDRDEAAALQRKMFNIQYLSHELVGIVHVPFAIKCPYFVPDDSECCICHFNRFNLLCSVSSLSFKLFFPRGRYRWKTSSKSDVKADRRCMLDRS